MVGGHIHAIADAMRRIVGLSAGWAVAGIAFECISLGGYVLLLSLVAGRATPRVDGPRQRPDHVRGRGGDAAAADRRRGRRGAGAVDVAARRPEVVGRGEDAALVPRRAVRGLPDRDRPVRRGADLRPRVRARPGGVERDSRPRWRSSRSAWRSLSRSSVPAPGSRSSRVGARIATAAQTVGAGVRDACRLVGSADLRLAGAIAYWAFDAAVLWAMLHAFGAAPLLPVVAIAYFVGQAANTSPIPGAVSGGIAGVLIAFGLPASIALPAVLAYRTVSVWLPTPIAVAALPGLRSTIARWGREDSALEPSLGTKAAV